MLESKITDLVERYTSSLSSFGECSNKIANASKLIASLQAKCNEQTKILSALLCDTVPSVEKARHVKESVINADELKDTIEKFDKAYSFNEMSIESNRNVLAKVEFSINLSECVPYSTFTPRF